MDQNYQQPSSDTAPKLTEWANEPTMLDLKNDFETARSLHNNLVSNIDRWDSLLNVTGSAKPKEVKNRSKVQPKLIRRQAEWRYAALSEPFLSSEKVFDVEPVTFEDEEGSKQNDILINYQWRTKLNKVKFIDNYVRSTVDEGSSIIRLGWKRETITVKETVPVYAYYPVDQQDEEYLQVFTEALQLSSENPRGFNESVPEELKEAVNYFKENDQVTRVIITGSEEVDVEKVVENKPTIELVNPRNFYIDPTCNDDADKALYAIVSFETNKAELLKEPNRYKNLDYIDWENATPGTDTDHSNMNLPDNMQFRDTLRKKVVAYEYWGFFDIHGTGQLVPIVCTWIGNVIIRMEENPFPDRKIPFVVVPYLPKKRELFGEPDAELLEDNQKILGALTRGMIDLLGRSANAQQGFAKGMLDPLNRRRFENGQDYEFNPTVNPTQGLIEHKYPELPRSAFEMLSLQNNEAEALTGVKAFSGGIDGTSYGDVVAGIRGALDAASKREMAILRRLAQGLKEVATKIIAMNAIFLSEEEVVRVTNQVYVTIKREDLAGNFDLKVDISTAEVDNAKAQDLAFMLQTIGPKGDPQMVFMILAEIADLKRMPALAHKLRTWKPEPTPQEQEMMELELELKRLEVDKLRSEIELNRAKAMETETKADQNNLDTIEQETGTKHARDLEKQGGQAKANQQLEITKGLLKPTKEGESRPDIEAAIGYNQLSEVLSNVI